MPGSEVEPRPIILPARTENACCHTTAARCQRFCRRGGGNGLPGYIGRSTYVPSSLPQELIASTLVYVGSSMLSPTRIYVAIEFLSANSLAVWFPVATEPGW